MGCSLIHQTIKLDVPSRISSNGNDGYMITQDQILKIHVSYMKKYVDLMPMISIPITPPPAYGLMEGTLGLLNKGRED